MTPSNIRKLKKAFQSRLVFYWKNRNEPAYRVLNMKRGAATLHGGGSVQLAECENSDFITALIFR